MGEIEETDVITTLLSKYGQLLDAYNKVAASRDAALADNTRLVMERRQSLRAMVRNFNVTYGIDMPSAPCFPSAEVQSLRRALIYEEYRELCVAIGTGDLVEIVDALGDLAFVIEGAFQAFGIDSGPVLSEIARSNQTKDKTPRAPGEKIKKGSDYSPPDLRGVLLAQGLKERAA